MRQDHPLDRRAPSAPDLRSSAVWGRGGRGRTAAIVFVFALVSVLQLALAVTASAARMPATLRSQALATPSAKFNVIVGGARGASTSAVASAITSAIKSNPGTAKGIKRKYVTVNAAASELTGAQINALDKNQTIGTIVSDAKVGAKGTLTNPQLWPDVAGVRDFWVGSQPKPATIAVVDSGVDASRADLAGRVSAQVTLTSSAANSTGDGRGHGTFVASLAAGAGDDYAGVAPTANIVSLDVLDDSGMGMTSDVIAAADWIYQNKGKYNIRVANFSLGSSTQSSFMYDPLDKAVEKLWLSGIVVVAAAGNDAVSGAASGVPYAPANDPFVITVGAIDSNGTLTASDDFAAPWSSFGYTLDGFAKPELSAPGRYIRGAVPSTSTMYNEHPERVVAPGYMWMSGTSFSAPIVAGSAAQLLGAHPSWTPDMVKGALMLRAQPGSNPTSLAMGVGEIKAGASNSGSDAPNPNAALNSFLIADPNGGTVPVFDEAAWNRTAQADAAWNRTTFESAAWNSAAWNRDAWATAAWNRTYFASATWSAGQTTDGVLPDAAWHRGTWVE